MATFFPKVGQAFFQSSGHPAQGWQGKPVNSGFRCPFWKKSPMYLHLKTSEWAEHNNIMYNRMFVGVSAYFGTVIRCQTGALYDFIP